VCQCALLSAASLFASSAAGALSPKARIDHIIIGTSDLTRGMAELARLTGVKPVFGGKHVGKGTQNALLSLGPGTYLELYAPNPAERVASSEVIGLQRLDKLTPLGWAISGDNLRDLRKRARAGGLAITQSEPGSRRRPDGALLRWSTFGYARFDDRAAPFFIAWADPRLHPSRTSPAGCRLKSLHIRSPEAPRLRRAISLLVDKVDAARAKRANIIVMLDCPKGRVQLG